MTVGIVFVWLEGWEGKAESIMRIEHWDSILGNRESREVISKKVEGIVH